MLFKIHVFQDPGFWGHSLGPGCRSKSSRHDSIAITINTSIYWTCIHLLRCDLGHTTKYCQILYDAVVPVKVYVLIDSLYNLKRWYSQDFNLAYAWSTVSFDNHSFVILNKLNRDNIKCFCSSILGFVWLSVSKIIPRSNMEL